MPISPTPNEIEATFDFPTTPSFEFSPDNEVEFAASVGIVVGALSDYEKLNNLPSIEGVKLVGDHTQEELGVNPIGNADILALFK